MACGSKNACQVTSQFSQNPSIESRLKRDRGEPHGSAPPTPPYMRVRIRRFGELSYRLTINLGIPSESKNALGSAICRPGESASLHGP